MSLWTRALERVGTLGGADRRPLGDLVGDDMASDEALGHLIGRVKAEDLHDLLGPDRLRIRPVLVALSARAAGAANVDPELQHAAELLHLALTMHDLTLGQPGGRRRRVARRVLKRMGGSHFTLRALELVRHVSPPDIMGEAVDTLRAFSDGQNLAQELSESGVLAATREAIHHADVHHGALLTFCCRAGAHVATADAATVASLGRYGRHLGRLWTLAEDHAALDSDSAALWLRDRATNGRPVLAVSSAAERDERIVGLWNELVSNGRGASELSRVVRGAGGLSATREAMAQSSWAAQQALRTLPESAYRDGLDALASGLARAS
ncbi:MAG: hypothetical protein AB8H79_11800 [Myxococcota bacterium]